MRFGVLFTVIFIWGASVSGGNFITADNPEIQYSGRVDFTNPKLPAFDWPGIRIEAVFEGTTCAIVLDGLNCYDAFVDGIHKAKIMVGASVDTFTIATDLTDRPHKLLIAKRTESTCNASHFHGFILDSGKALLKSPQPPSRKIEFIGDSYTVGFANESLRREYPSEKIDSVITACTNTNAAFGPLTARAFGAQYQINAVSGKGLVRNYNGIEKGKELLYYYDRTLISVQNENGKSPKWNFSWKPDLVVIGIGINDFQADPPYADSAKFDSTYNAFLDYLRNKYPGVIFILCATKIWPNDTLIPRVKKIVEDQKAGGRGDVWYYEYKAENGALYGHPNIYDHQTISNGLIPVVAKATGWNRVDLMRGK